MNQLESNLQNDFFVYNYLLQNEHVQEKTNFY